MLKKIKGIIFDLDGVITDTSALHKKAWEKLAEKKGIPFDEETADKLRGISREKSLEVILENACKKHGVKKQYTHEQFNELMEIKNNCYKKNLSGLNPNDIFPGVAELLDTLKNKGYKLAIGSSSKNAGLVIKNLQIKNKFDAIVDGAEITRSKPYPEIFQKAADKLGLPHGQCAVVEDAASGIEAANAAGMVSIGIGPENRFNEKNQKPDFRFDDIQALSNQRNELFEDLK